MLAQASRRGPTEVVGIDASASEWGRASGMSHPGHDKARALHPTAAGREAMRRTRCGGAETRPGERSDRETRIEPVRGSGPGSAGTLPVTQVTGNGPSRKAGCHLALLPCQEGIWPVIPRRQGEGAGWRLDALGDFC